MAWKQLLAPLRSLQTPLSLLHQQRTKAGAFLAPQPFGAGPGPARATGAYGKVHWLRPHGRFNRMIRNLRGMGLAELPSPAVAQGRSLQDGVESRQEKRGHFNPLKPAPLPQSGRSGPSSMKKGGGPAAGAPLRPIHRRGKLWAWSRQPGSLSVGPSQLAEGRSGVPQALAAESPAWVAACPSRSPRPVVAG